MRGEYASRARAPIETQLGAALQARSPMNLVLLAILLLAAALAWWLSGRDSAITGENRAADFVRRAWRCGVTLLLVWAGAAAIIHGGARGGFVLIGIALPLAILWTGIVSELLASAFHQLIDPDDHRELDLHQSVRDLDRLGELVQNGQNDEAIQLCACLLESGEVSKLSMDTLLFRIYGQVFAEDRLCASPGLAENLRLCREGRGLEAESRLKELLDREPQNLAALLLLLRLYTRDLARLDQAEALLHTVEDRPKVPPGFIDFARWSMGEWMAGNSANVKGAEGIESLLVDKKYSQRPKP